MTVSLSVSWDDTKKKRRIAALAVLLLAFVPIPQLSRSRHSTTLASVIVESVPGRASDARTAISKLGGTVERDLGIIGGFAASIPSDGIAALRSSDAIRSVTTDTPVQLHSTTDPAPYDPSTDMGSMYRATRVIGARSLWAQGITGQGVDVALIDSGVVPVDGLVSPDKIVNGPDLSFESSSPDLRYLDTFGHGTHMAGIIAGRASAISVDDDLRNSDNFAGVAPGARIVNVKVANALGATDVSQVIAAIDWVVQHRHDHGLNIRVLNLSFGTDGNQDYLLDPLVHAADVAWRDGIVVVVAAGNRGEGSGRLDNPARDPQLIAVGGDDPKGTTSTADDTVPAWSSSGDGVRNPDLVAPGRSIVSLRDEGSYIDQTHPEGRVASTFFRGSGTSAATAMVSGSVALLLQQRPDLTPDQVKALLTSTAHPTGDPDATREGAGVLSVRDASRAPTPDVDAPPPIDPTAPPAGSGSIEGARGSAHVQHDGTVLEGEQDIFGASWDGDRWARESSDETSWSGGMWNGNQWSGDGWSADSWAGAAWSSADGSNGDWSGNSWSGNSWSGTSWSGNSWSGNSWSGNSWSGNSWSFIEMDG
jgi:serine protease AprX